MYVFLSRIYKKNLLEVYKKSTKNLQKNLLEFYEKIYTKSTKKKKKGKSKLVEHFENGKRYHNIFSFPPSGKS